MNLVDRDRRFAVVLPPALRHPHPVMPDMARRVGDDRRGARRLLGALGVGIGLQRQQLAVRPVHLVFVEMPRPQPRHEEFPEPAGTAQPHRHPPAVPGIEIADDADRAGIGRPHRKGDALDALMRDRMRAELLVAREMIAFGEQMKVELAQHRRKAIDVVEFAGDAAIRHPQPIAERLAPICDLRDKEAVGMDPHAFASDRAGRAVDDATPAGRPATSPARQRPSRSCACRGRRTGRRGAPRQWPRSPGRGPPAPTPAARLSSARRGSAPRVSVRRSAPSRRAASSPRPALRVCRSRPPRIRALRHRSPSLSGSRCQGRPAAEYPPRTAGSPVRKKSRRPPFRA